MRRYVTYRIGGRGFAVRRSGPVGAEVRGEGETAWTKYIGAGLLDGKQVDLKKAAWIHSLQQDPGFSSANPKKV